MNEDIFNGAFWIAICGVIAGILGLVFKAINTSKCSSVTCCFGMFGCARNIEIEKELEEFKVIHGVPSTPTIQSNVV